MGIRGILRAAVLLLLIRTWLVEGYDTTPLPEFHFELSSTVPEVVQNVFNCKNCANEAVVHKILDRVLSQYDARLRPNFGGAPVPVGISMYISSIDHISEMTMDYTITVFFHQTWKDPRLAYYETNLNLTLDYRMLEKLWVPDCYFLNSKDAFVHEMTVENRMFQLHPDGTVQYGLRLTTTAACSMNLQNFPLDKQTCKLEVESYGYTVEDIMLYWEGDDNAVQGTEKLHIPQFTLLGKTVTSKQERFYTGSYVRLILRFLVQRGILSYLVQIYWPTVLITTGSWITFWMNYKFSVTRVTVGLTSMLILNAINSHLRDRLPQFSCIKAIDIYMVACFFFVFLSLLEYVFINYLFYNRGGTWRHHSRHRSARRIMNRYHYQPHVHQRPQEEEILSVEEINNHITSADEEGPVPPPSPKVLIHVGFESTDFLSLSTVSSEGDQVNIKDEGGYPPSSSLQAWQASPESLNYLTFIPEQAPMATPESLNYLTFIPEQAPMATPESLNYLTFIPEQAPMATPESLNYLTFIPEQAPMATPESLNYLTFIPEQAPMATSESLSSLSSLSGQSWMAIGESLNDFSSTPEQALHVHSQGYMHEAYCNPGNIPRISEEFLSMPDDVKVDCGYPDPRMQFQHDDDTTWSRDGDNFMGFDQDEDSNSESGDSCPPSPGYSFSERFLYDLFDPDYVSKVDKWSRIIFPIAFVVFNVVYWPYNAI